MSNSTTVDYANSCFEYPVLDCIHGEPTYETLKVIHKQLKTNAQTVGDPKSFGYLGLVLSLQDYAQVNNTPFQRPTDPGTINIPVFSTITDTFCLREEHDDAKRCF